jgi:hypothetical protein
MAEKTEAQLLAEIATLARELRERALAGGDHGLAVTASVIADHAGVGAWSIGAVMADDGFRPEAT